MSTATNHRTRSHRTYYIRKSATTGHARQAWIKTQNDKHNRQQRSGGFFGRLFRGRNKEAHDAAES
jgi:hypothetical protein